MAELSDSRRLRRVSTSVMPTSWLSWLGYFVGAGVIAGVLWWSLAPGGAFYGDGKDYEVWFPRDATLGALMVLGGLLSAVLALRGKISPRREVSAELERPTRALYLVLMLGGLLASVLAWRIGVFAGDLFHTPPVNMANPSIVFSLRSPTVLILWPLMSSVVVVLNKLFHYFLGTGPTVETMPAERTLNG